MTNTKTKTKQKSKSINIWDNSAADVKANMAALGVRFESEKLGHCVCSAHTNGDKKPSLSIKEDGCWYCHTAGTGGHFAEYEMLVTGETDRQKACIAARKRIGKEVPVESSAAVIGNEKLKRKRVEKEAEKDFAAKKGKNRCFKPVGEMRHDYFMDGQEEPVFFVVRRPKGYGSAKTLPFHFVGEGKESEANSKRENWVCGLPGEYLADGAGWAKPLYLGGSRRAEVFLPKAKVIKFVEGERDADNMNKFLFERMGVGETQVVSWYGGVGGVRHANLDQLKHAKGIEEFHLYADTDENGAGASAVDEMAERLVQWGYSPDIIHVIKWEEDGPKDFSAAEDSGTDSAVGYINGDGAERSHPRSLKEIEDSLTLGFEKNEFFQLLGESDGFLYFYDRKRLEIKWVKSCCTDAGKWTDLAPKRFWQDLAEDAGVEGINFDKASGKAALNIQDTIKERARNLPRFDPESARGLGLHRDGDKWVFHFGDRLEVDGKVVDMKDNDLKGVYVSRPTLDVADKESTAEEVRQVVSLFKKYQWDGEESMAATCGLIPVMVSGGGLKTRPRSFIIAGGGKGKTYFQKTLARLMGGLMSSYSNTTAAALVRKVGEDCIGVYLDEMHKNPNEKFSRFDGLLEMVRAAYDETSAWARCDKSGAVQERKMKWTVICSSTEMPDMANMDRSRQKECRLKNMEFYLNRDFLTDEFCRRFRRWLINRAPQFVEFVNKRIKEEGGGDRGKNTSLPASAGWEWLSGERVTITPDYREGAEVEQALGRVWNMRVNIGRHGFSAGELLIAAWNKRGVRVLDAGLRAGEDGIDEDGVKEALARVGLRFREKCLLIARGHDGLKGALKTKNANADAERDVISVLRSFAKETGGADDAMATFAGSRKWALKITQAGLFEKGYSLLQTTDECFDDAAGFDSERTSPRQSKESAVSVAQAAGSPAAVPAGEEYMEWEPGNE